MKRLLVVVITTAAIGVAGLALPAGATNPALRQWWKTNGLAVDVLSSNVTALNVDLYTETNRHITWLAFQTVAREVEEEAAALLKLTPPPGYDRKDWHSVLLSVRALGTDSYASAKKHLASERLGNRRNIPSQTLVDSVLKKWNGIFRFLSDNGIVLKTLFSG